MRIGIPKEVKIREGRVALIPPAVDELIKQGHEVFIQSGAVPRMASQALSIVLTHHVPRLATEGGLQDPAIAKGINVAGGKVVPPAVAALSG
ncbi:MAG: hypothetical protein A3D32_00365 [Candidatus Muproteobacteria bacterium RIFCSPHIGHO2_02_FULL_60_13]|nr:MAG: hypothetical protein A2W42_06605 [Candidatus Muproteobacteria bacterium RIFCSPHIGHO2_01_60_12]OGI54034.1 MAG: hypothetical protein A3D32_00365 [Candidatus Muproteobacteria bacterium RIFCSPHIGHO2_02_FULL_60_13]